MIVASWSGVCAGAAEAAAAADELADGQSSQLLPEVLGCGDDDAAQLDERDAADVDGASACQEQYP